MEDNLKKKLTKNEIKELKGVYVEAEKIRNKFKPYKLKNNCSTCNLHNHCNILVAIKKEFLEMPKEELCCSGYGKKGTTLYR
jgi:hypothetical protein